MAQIAIGRVGSDVVLASDVCVKTGLPTSERVTIRGATVPSWIHALLVFTFLGWVFANAAASRRYRISVPFRHDAYNRWRRVRSLAWILGGAGIVLTVGSLRAGVSDGGAFLCLSAGALVLGVANGLLGTIGVRQHGDRLVVTRVHRDAAVAIEETRQPARIAIWPR